MPGDPVQAFNRPHDQVAVGRMRHRFGLDCGIHGDPLQLGTSKNPDPRSLGRHGFNPASRLRDVPTPHPNAPARRL